MRWLTEAEAICLLLARGGRARPAAAAARFLSSAHCSFLRGVAVQGPCYKERRSPHKSPSLKVKLKICLWTYGGRTLNNGARLYFVHGTVRLRRGKTLRCAQNLLAAFARRLRRSAMHFSSSDQRPAAARQPLSGGVQTSKLQNGIFCILLRS